MKRREPDIRHRRTSIGVAVATLSILLPLLATPPAGATVVTVAVGSARQLTAAPDVLVLTGTSGSDTIIVLSGRSVADLDGDGHADVTLAAGAARPAQIVVRAGGGNDLVDASASRVGLVIDGGPGDDVLIGSQGSDRIVGSDGSDVIDGAGAGGAASCSVAIDPATGQVKVTAFGGDVMDYTSSAGPIDADLDPGEQHPGKAIKPNGTDVLQNVEHLIGSPGNDRLSGDDAGNALSGGGGDDTIAGDAGDDCELGGDGNDTFDENEGVSLAQGGNGVTNGADWLFGNVGLDDTVTYSARTTRVSVSLEPLFGTLADGADTGGDGIADELDHVFLDIENAIGGANNDILSANLVSNRADNELTGGPGNDRMDGGAGNDAFHEGPATSGADTMDGGSGLDVCDYSARTVGVSVLLEGGDGDGEPGEGDNCGGVFSPPGEEQPNEPGGNVESVLGGSGPDVIRGNPAGNVLSGGAGDDVLTGRDGIDVLSGGDGDDTLAGNGGDDSLDGGAGTDTVDFASAGNRGVRVSLPASRATGEGNDTLAGFENVNGSSFADTVLGDAGPNVLLGRGGNDSINGAEGDDTIDGGDGSDELGGGAGNDTIAGGVGSDAIRGEAGDDRLSGGPGADTVLAGGGDDTLAGGAGKDDLRGGPGRDRCDPGTPGVARGDRVAGCEA